MCPKLGSRQVGKACTTGDGFFYFPRFHMLKQLARSLSLDTNHHRFSQGFCTPYYREHFSHVDGYLVIYELEKYSHAMVTSFSRLVQRRASRAENSNYLSTYAQRLTSHSNWTILLHEFEARRHESRWLGGAKPDYKRWPWL